MGFWDWLTGRENAALESSPPSLAVTPSMSGPRADSLLVHDLNSAEVAEYLRSGQMSMAGVPVNARNAMRSAAVNRCVRLISDTVSTMTLDVKERINEREVRKADNHPMSRVLKRRPNSWQTPTEFKRYIEDCVLLRGNGYALKVISRGQVRELIPLLPDRVSIKQNADLSLTYTYTRKDGGMVVLSQDDIVHWRGPTEDGYTGMSVISHAANNIGLAGSINRHSSNIFKNGAAVSGILSHPKTLNDAAIERIKAQMNSFAGGGENAARNLVVEEGMTYAPLSMTSVDAQLLEIMEATDVQIAMFFGVPPHMLGIMTKSTSFGAGIGQMGQQFVDYTLMPHISLWQETLNRDTLREDDKFYFKFNTSSLVRGNLPERFKAYAVGRQWGIFSINDIREMEDLNPVEGGDTYHVPLNMVPLGMEFDAADNSNDTSTQEGSQDDA
jgi:HK97 family phage portal protein